MKYIDKYNVYSEKQINCELNMYATYKMKPEEFTYEFFLTLKNTFKDKEVTLYIEENNETDYLLKSSVNSAMIFNSIQELKNGETKSFSYQEFEKSL